MATKHRMVIGQEDEKGVRWDCPICGHSILIGGGKIRTINAGDFNAQHSGFSSREHPEAGSSEISMGVKVKLPDLDTPATC